MEYTQQRSEVNNKQLEAFFNSNSRGTSPAHILWRGLPLPLPGPISLPLKVASPPWVNISDLPPRIRGRRTYKVDSEGSGNRPPCRIDLLVSSLDLGDTSTWGYVRVSFVCAEAASEIEPGYSGVEGDCASVGGRVRLCVCVVVEPGVG